MDAYEKLGSFYLGKAYDVASQTLFPDPVLYDSKDLTTHAVIIGMTGSGKTGMGIALLEEALIDKIPIIAIDPKGDLTNLALLKGWPLNIVVVDILWGIVLSGIVSTTGYGIAKWLS